jgi:pyruvate/2-oxoglutarate dehydrogenase complex dihydrolipoamide acyltransferase (E2) component
VLKDIIMPRLGDTSEQGWVESWSKSVGDEVEMGEEICTVSVDKAAFELESPYDGKLREILVENEVLVPVGTVIARIEVPD